MKYLKLDCNNDTLKIANSILPCKCGKGVGWNPMFCGSDLGAFLLTNESDEETWIEFSQSTVFIPVENIAIDPFKAMQHQLPIVADFEIVMSDNCGTTSELITHKGVLFKAEQDNDEFTFMMSWTEQGSEDWDEIEEYVITESIRLDYSELPKGAEVVELD